MSETLQLPANLIKAEQCSGCKFSHQEGGDLHCRRGPPHTTVIMVPLPPPRVGQVSPQPFCGQPLTRPNGWCGEYRPKNSI